MLTLVAGILFVAPTAAFAHPLGNFTANTAAALVAGADDILTF